MQPQRRRLTEAQQLAWSAFDPDVATFDHQTLVRYADARSSSTEGSDLARRHAYEQLRTLMAGASGTVEHRLPLSGVVAAFEAGAAAAIREAGGDPDAEIDRDPDTLERR